MIDISVDTAGLHAKMEDAKELLPKIVEETTYELEKEIKTNAPKRTGRLAESWQAVKVEDLTWGLKSDAPYRWAVRGSRAHSILPHKGNVLAFWSAQDGQWRFVTEVSHPGITGFDYVKVSVDFVEDRLWLIKERVVRNEQGF